MADCRRAVDVAGDSGAVEVRRRGQIRFPLALGARDGDWWGEDPVGCWAWLGKTNPSPWGTAFQAVIGGGGRLVWRVDCV